MMLRTLWARRLAGAAILAMGLAAGPALAQTPVEGPAVQAEVQSFVEGLWPEARARGVSRGMFDQAFAGVGPDAKIVALSEKQSEFVRPVWDYIAGAVTPARMSKGQQVSD